MRLRAGNINDTINKWQQYQSNCHYDSNKCQQYYIPIDVESSKDLYWYMDLEKQPASVKHYMVDICTGTYAIKKPRFYLYAKNDEGYYGVINGYTSLPYEQFCIAVEVTYTDGTKQYFYSESYQKAKACENINTVYACYNKKDNGGFDANGIYTGQPVTKYLGNQDLRYYHNYTARDLKFLYSGKKITYTALNYRPTKSVQDKTATLYVEVMPYWYEEYFSQAFAKGTVIIDDYQYTITDYSSSIIGDPCCERLDINATATKTTSVTFTCSTDTCNVLACVAASLNKTTFKICPTDATFTKQIVVSGTAPIEVDLIDNGGYNFSYSLSTNTITISSSPAKVGSVKVLVSNCAGDFEQTINFVAGGCCDLGTLTITDDPNCELGTLSLNDFNPN